MAARPLTVGIITPPWRPVPTEGRGEQEAFADTLARGLHAAGHEVLLFATGDSTCPVPRRSSFRRSLGRPEHEARYEARQVVEGYDALAGADIVHDQTVVGPLYSISRRGRPVVTTSLGTVDEHLTPVYRAIAGRVGIVAVSRHQAATASGWTPLSVVRPGVDLGSIPVGGGEGGYALFVATAHGDPALEMAAAAAAHAGHRLVIAADVSCSEELRNLEADLGPLVGHNIEYAGRVGAEERLALLGGAACLLNPMQRADPYGLVMIEALAAGTPVVASARGAAPEIVENGVTGYCCRGERSLARALLDVSDLDRARCRESAEKRFSLERMVDEYVSLYRAALAPVASYATPDTAA